MKRIIFLALVVLLFCFTGAQSTLANDLTFGFLQRELLFGGTEIEFLPDTSGRVDQDGFLVRLGRQETGFRYYFLPEGQKFFWPEDACGEFSFHRAYKRDRYLVGPAVCQNNFGCMSKRAVLPNLEEITDLENWVEAWVEKPTLKINLQEGACIISAARFLGRRADGVRVRYGRGTLKFLVERYFPVGETVPLPRKFDRITVQWFFQDGEERIFSPASEARYRSR